MGGEEGEGAKSCDGKNSVVFYNMLNTLWFLELAYLREVSQLSGVSTEPKTTKSLHNRDSIISPCIFKCGYSPCCLSVSVRHLVSPVPE